MTAETNLIADDEHGAPMSGDAIACVSCEPVSTFDSAADEVKRLAALQRTGLLDTPQEEAFDRLTRLAARLLGAPVALLSLVDHDRQFFKSTTGLEGTRASIRETPRSISFCQHVVARRAPLIINDAREDALMRDSPAIQELGVVAYLGVPILAEGSHVIGSLCVNDSKPRAWTQEDVRTLEELSQITMTEIALREKAREREASLAVLRASEVRFSGAFEHAPIGVALLAPDGHWLKANRALCDFLGYSEAELLTRSFQDITYPEDLEAGLEQTRRMLAGEIGFFQMEKRYIHRGGHLVAALLNVSLVRDGKGQPSYMIAQTQDMTERKRTLEELERTREQYAGLVNSMDGIVWEADATSFQFTFVSERAEHILGFPTAQWVSVPNFWANQIHPADREESVSYCVSCTGRKENHTFEYRMLAADGRVVWMRDIVTYVEEPGKPALLRGIMLDITERKQAEAETHRSKKRLRDLIDGVGPTIFVGLMTPEGILIECNRPALTAAGLKAEDVLGKPFVETHWWCHSPEAQQQLREAIARAALGEASRYDVQTRVAGDQLIDVDFSLQPLRDETGEVVFLVPSASIITERKLAENALRESQRFAESIAENSTSTIYLFDLETRTSIYTNRNAAEALGYSPAQILEMGDNFLPTIIHPEDLPRVIQQQAHFAEVKDNRVFDLELRVKSATGEWRWTWTRETVFKRRPNGAAWQVMGTAQDITERKQAEVALGLAHKQLVTASHQAGMAEVATSVLHNVGNVLNSVNTSLSVAADKVGQLKAGGLGRIAALVNEHAENLPAFFAEHPQGVRLPKFLTQLAEHFATEQQTVLRELASLRGNLEHINEIVAMQQGFAGAGGLLETLPLSELIDDALRINAASFERHGTSVACEIDPALPPIPVDRNKLLLILVNLIRNAKHACDDGGGAKKLITVRAQLNGGGCAKISVADNGIGIPVGNLTRIFEHGFTTRKHGHGFGLHSSALAASEMGGSLHAHSDGPGHGATFTIELPLSPTNS